MGSGTEGDRGSDGPEELAPFDWDAEVVELSRHLDRLWQVGGDQDSAVSEMVNVRAGLFGYGRIGTD